MSNTVKDNLELQLAYEKARIKRSFEKIEDYKEAIIQEEKKMEHIHLYVKELEEILSKI